MKNRLPDEKIEALRELCRKHSGMELTHEEAAEFGAYYPLGSRWKLAAAAKHPICCASWIPLTMRHAEASD